MNILCTKVFNLVDKTIFKVLTTSNLSEKINNVKVS